MEDNLRRALLISDGDWGVLWQSPLAKGLWAAAAASLLAPLLLARLVERRRRELFERRP